MEGDLVGRTLFGTLRVLRPLGAGGMGTVYEVEHLSWARRCALKVLHPALASDAQAVARLLREGTIGQRIQSPRVAQTFGAGQLEDGRVYLLMELLEGRSLRERLRESGPLPATEVARLGAQIGEGLAAAHAVGVVHRDLTPANVFLVGPRGAEDVKLLDFGLSRMLPGHTDRFGALTAAGTLLGTPSYLAPEQVGGRTVDARSDQYGLAVVLYECFGGEKAFAGEQLTEVLARIAAGDHVPLRARVPSLDPGLAAAVERAMSVDPAARFGHLGELVDALRAFSAPAPGAVAATQVLAAPGAAPSSSHPSVSHGHPGAAGGHVASTVALPSGAPTDPSAWSHGQPSPRTRPASGSLPVRAIAIGVAAVFGGVVALGGALLATRAYLLRQDAGSAPPAASSAGTPPAEAPLLPDDMRGYPELQSLHANHEYRECLDYARGLPQTVHVLELRVSCAAYIQDWAQYREACEALSRIDPANETVRHCLPALPTLPP